MLWCKSRMIMVWLVKCIMTWITMFAYAHFSHQAEISSRTGVPMKIFSLTSLRDKEILELSTFSKHLFYISSEVSIRVSLPNIHKTLWWNWLKIIYCQKSLSSNGVKKKLLLIRTAVFVTRKPRRNSKSLK